jgi:hypothetical protein
VVNFKEFHENAICAATIELDITDFCNMKCFMCSRGCDLNNIKKGMLSISDIEKFLKESVDIDYKWKIIRIIGGEPTIHPDFIKIIDIIYDYKIKHNPDLKIWLTTNGVTEKSRQLAAAVAERLFFLDATGKVAGEYVNPGFWSPYMKPADLGITIDEQFMIRCIAPSEYAMSLTSAGYCICGCHSSVFLRILGKDSEMKSVKDLLNTEKFTKQMKELCSICGFQVKTYEFNVSDYWKKVFEEKNIKPEFMEYNK